MDAVAARAHAGKTTIYRRWSGKAELIVDALKGANDVQELPDTGSLAGDLEAAAATIACADSQFDAQLTIGMVTALTRDAQLRQVFQERLFEPQLASIRQVFERAVVRGEISNDRDLDLLALLLPALSLHRLVTVGEMPEVGFAQRIVEEVILPLATAPTKDTPPPSNTPA
jgi:AcrR family transcriptional regulator